MKTEAPSLGRENFVSHLYQMLENPDFYDTVSWNQSEEGPSFVITDASRFQDYVLVHEFNHANFSSFVRQLNKYDFHKVKFRDSQSRVWEFIHPLFRPENRDKPQLIKRKQQQSTKKTKSSSNAPEAEIISKAVESAAKDTEEILKNELEVLSARIGRLESSNLNLYAVVRMQQGLIARLLEVTHLNLDPNTGMPLNPGMPMPGMMNPGPPPPPQPRAPDTHMHEMTGIQEENSSATPPQTSNPATNVGPSGAPNLQPRTPTSIPPAMQPNTVQPRVPPAVQTVMPPNVQVLTLQQQQKQQQTQQQAMQPGIQTHPPNVQLQHPRVKVENVYMQPPLRDPNQRSVLLAIDNESAREVTTNFLHAMNYQVHAVDSGAEVVQKAESKLYDYIILEPILKSLDGLSAVEIIRQSNIRTPIVLLLDNTSQEDIDCYMQRGVSSILYRPFTRGELQQVLFRFNNQQRS